MLSNLNALRGRNTHVATMWCVVLAVLVPITGVRAAGMPSPTDTMSAYRTVRGWMASGLLDRDPDALSDAADPEGLRSACVTMRLEGRVIGRGLSWSDDGRDLHRAAQRAWESARVSVGAGLEDHAGAIALDIELGGALTPLVGESELDFIAQINPGLDGIAVRAGERIGVTFPGQMLASGWTPAQGLTHAIAPLDLPALDFQTMRNRYGLVVYRFRAEHLAQRSAAVEPEFLHRGGRLIPMGEVSGARTLEAAGGAASFLERLLWPGPEPHGIRGDYHAVTDVYEPTLSPPSSQTVAAWALAVYAQTPGVDPADASRALRAAREIVSDLTIATEFESDPGLDPGALSLWYLALFETGGAGAFGDGEDAARIEAFADGVVDGLMALTEDVDARDRLSASVRALIALALAYAGGEPGAAAAITERAESLARWLYVETEPGDLVSLMPWLGMASVALAGGDDEIRASAALREMRSAVWRFTLAGADADASTGDLVGGVVFTRGRTALPSWQTLRPVSFLAVMAGDPRLTDAGERGEAWTTLTESLRFAMQLQAGRAEGHMYARPDTAIGGVRLALWDQRCSVNATALALVSWCEALRSAERMAGAGE